jgi:hypothetical protein
MNNPFESEKSPYYLTFVTDAVSLLRDLSFHKVMPNLIFMDPPDNIKLGYQGYDDNLPSHAYYGMLESCLIWSMKISPVVYLSYYWKHDLEIKYMVHTLLKRMYPSFDAKTFIWRFTFGQHNEHDFGSGYRPLLRLIRKGTEVHPPRIVSKRQELGDIRANTDGRIPDDVWEFSRIQGNNSERRSWHPTQHPEMLLDRIIRSHTNGLDLVVDPFAGTGTTLRVSHYLKRSCITSDINPEYIQRINDEMVHI